MTLFDELLAVLAGENRLLKELIELGQKKQAVINEAEEVANLATQEESILADLETVDRERKVLFEAIAPGLGVQEWVLRLAARQQEQVAPLITELAENLAILQSLNHLNQELLAESLAFVQFSLNILLADEGGGTYARTGSTTQEKTIFDRKV